MKTESLKSIAAVQLAALEHQDWMQVEERLQLALTSRGLLQLSTPVTLVLHDLLEGAVKAMHVLGLQEILEAEFDIAGDQVSMAGEFYQTEVREHGTQNLVRYCRDQGWYVKVTFPDETDVLVAITLPSKLHLAECRTAALMKTAGLVVRQEDITESDGSHLWLVHQAQSQKPTATVKLIDEAALQAGFDAIASRLGYGLIHFSSVGEITALSQSVFETLGLDPLDDSLDKIGQLIPLTFYDDIIWGLALSDNDGRFENYRIRVTLAAETGISILFNVSGFRDENAIVHSLWQVVSREEGGNDARLGEGSILSEARISNITRHYVPQLVAEKAREAIRLGRNQLNNEERQVAVLFCDIVGFTAFAESQAASESVIDTLNSILRRVAGSVSRHAGYIDKFMGDCILALFDNPASAIRAAVEMQGHSEDVNNLRSRAGQQVLRLRIGIHWGMVVIGNVGTIERLDWTAVGDVVNTASRIEKACLPGEVLISQELRNALDVSVPLGFTFGEVRHLQLKGKGATIAVCAAHLNAQSDGS